MNYEQTIEAIKVMQHYAAGGEIEHRDRPTSCSREWRPLIDPYWDWSTTEYRIKPRPLERWVVVDTAGEMRATESGGFRTREDAEGFANDAAEEGWPCIPYRVVHMREVV